MLKLLSVMMDDSLKHKMSVFFISAQVDVFLKFRHFCVFREQAGRPEESADAAPDVQVEERPLAVDEEEKVTHVEVQVQLHGDEQVVEKEKEKDVDHEKGKENGENDEKGDEIVKEEEEQEETAEEKEKEKENEKGPVPSEMAAVEEKGSSDVEKEEKEVKEEKEEREIKENEANEASEERNGESDEKERERSEDENENEKKEERKDPEPEVRKEESDSDSSEV